MKGMQRNRNFLRAFFQLLVSLALLCSGIETSASGPNGSDSPLFTTIIVMRHADRSREGDLTLEGKSRALDLVHVLGDTGIRAIYTTDVQRTKDTVQPLALYLGIRPEIYGRNLKELSDKVLSQHKGELVLVVGHDDTVQGIIEALIGRRVERTPGVQFDDLHIVTVDRSGNGSVLSMKYGNPIGINKDWLLERIRALLRWGSKLL